MQNLKMLCLPGLCPGPHWGELAALPQNPFLK